MQKKKQSEVSVFHPQEKPVRELPCGAQLKEFNLVLGSTHHLSQPWAASVFTDMAEYDGLPWWWSILSLFTFHTGHSRDPNVCFIIPEPQNNQMMPFTGQILPSDSHFVPSKQWTQLCGWLNLPHIWMTPFGIIPACFQHHSCGVYPTNPSHMHDQTHSTNMVMVMPGRATTHGSG